MPSRGWPSPAPPTKPPLHPDLRVVAEPGRGGLLRDHHPPSHPPRQLRTGPLRSCRSARAGFRHKPTTSRPWPPVGVVGGELERLASPRLDPVLPQFRDHMVRLTISGQQHDPCPLCPGSRMQATPPAPRVLGLPRTPRPRPPRRLAAPGDGHLRHPQDPRRQGLAGHPRIRVHFTPTSGSWLNLVEVFFGIITRQAIRHGSFDSVPDLVGAIRALIAGWNDRCHPFAWSKTADEIPPHTTANEIQTRNASRSDSGYWRAQHSRSPRPPRACRRPPTISMTRSPPRPQRSPVSPLRDGPSAGAA